MNRDQSLLNRQVFERTTALFSKKREVLPPDAVRAVANDIVRRLAQSPFVQQPVDVPQISDEASSAFCDQLVKSDPDAALQFVEDRRAEGLTRLGVLLGYIPKAARCLGERWDRDEVSFLQVTSGTGYLYALMRALRAELPFNQRKFDNRRVALFATVPGEDHGLGITVAADMFREGGWEIDLETGTDHDELVALVEQTQPQIIGLSFSAEDRLDALVRLVLAFRLLVPDAIIGVAPPGDFAVSRLHNLLDIDLFFTDAQSAYRELDRLLRLRSQEVC